MIDTRGDEIDHTRRSRIEQEDCGSEEKETKNRCHGGRENRLVCDI
jgi:hypothetical protein